MSDEKTMGQLVQIDEYAWIRDHLGEMVREYYRCWHNNHQSGSIVCVSS
jgi:hypothetical protein